MRHVPMHERDGDPANGAGLAASLEIDDLLDADLVGPETEPARLAAGSEVHDRGALRREAEIDALLAAYLLDVDEPAVDDP